VKRVYIPKGGDPHKLRPIGMPTVGSQCTSYNIVSGSC
jgi:hypothetical protein